MKKTVIILMAIISLVSCKNEKETQIEEVTVETQSEIQPINDDVLESAVIYEANIRQYSEAGTFDEFTKDIPQLRDLGVKIIWLMPINPIS